jgi:hypothetical protein
MYSVQTQLFSSVFNLRLVICLDVKYTDKEGQLQLGTFGLFHGNDFY